MKKEWIVFSTYYLFQWIINDVDLNQHRLLILFFTDSTIKAAVLEYRHSEYSSRVLWDRTFSRTWYFRGVPKIPIREHDIFADWDLNHDSFLVFKSSKSWSLTLYFCDFVKIAKSAKVTSPWKCTVLLYWLNTQENSRVLSSIFKCIVEYWAQTQGVK